MIDELGYPVTPERIEQLRMAFMVLSDTTSREVGLIVDALTARIAALEAALTYYAEIRNYSTAGGDPLDAEPFILSDRGRRARAALAGEGQG